LSLPVRNQSKEIKSIYTEKNYGLILWDDNSLSLLSKWGLNSSPTPTGDTLKNKFIDLSINRVTVLTVNNLFKLGGFGGDGTIFSSTVFNTINQQKVLKVKISPTTASQSNFAFVIVDDGTGQNKGTIRGWGFNMFRYKFIKSTY
jgi:hypothetical protein